MQKQYVTDNLTWDRIVSGLPASHVLQSWGWGEFKARWGWRPTRVLWHDSGRPLAAAQFLRRAIPGTPFGVGYVAKGPCLPADDGPLAARVLCDLEIEARRQRCLFVKIDPDIEATNECFAQLLRGRGWHPSPEQIQFRNTAVLDLRRSETELLAAMKSKTRYNIRLAARKEVEVRPGSAVDHIIFYDMYRETAERDGFLIRPMAYYLDLWHEFETHGQARLFVAWYDKLEPLAGLMLFTYGSTAWFFYGASTVQHRNAMPNYALQWEAITWVKAQGYTCYDLWGAPTDLEDPHDPLTRVWRFKEGFGAGFRAHIGAWDYPVNRGSYWVMTRAIPAVRALLRRTRRSRLAVDRR
ncbi:MAG TPA: methicillin resistance protein [Chloroflexi bacterium]|nr:methicillin resistance protein [Chloroflexota bacterium]